MTEPQNGTPSPSTEFWCEMPQKWGPGTPFRRARRRPRRLRRRASPWRAARARAWAGHWAARAWVRCLALARLGQASQPAGPRLAAGLVRWWAEPAQLHWETH